MNCPFHHMLEKCRAGSALIVTSACWNVHPERIPAERSAGTPLSTATWESAAAYGRWLDSPVRAEMGPELQRLQTALVGPGAPGR